MAATKQPNGVLGNASVYRVDPREIKIDETWNPRTSFGDLNELAKSVEQNGVLNPVILRRNDEGGLSVVDGERRVRATMLAIVNGCDIQSIPAFIRAKTANKAELLIQTCAASDGAKRFEPIELAEAYRRLGVWGWSQAKIAERMGRSQSHVSNTLKLLDKPDEIVTALQNGEITASDVVAAERNGHSHAVVANALEELKTAPHVPTRKRTKKPLTVADVKDGKGKNSPMLNKLRAELSRGFGDLDAFTRDKVAHANLSMSKGEQRAYKLGRLSILCEMAQKGATLDDIASLLG